MCHDEGTTQVCPHCLGRLLVAVSFKDFKHCDEWHKKYAETGVHPEEEKCPNWDGSFSYITPAASGDWCAVQCTEEAVLFQSSRN